MKGLVYRNLGEHQKAIAFYEQSLEISRNIGNRHSEAANLSDLGIVYNSLGKIEKACSLCNEALVIFEVIESPNANVIRQWIAENC